MDCKEVVEHISSFIDGELEGTVESSIQQHLSLCKHCRQEAELERMTKNVIRQRLPLIGTPQALAAHVRGQLQTETRAFSSSKGFFDALLQQLTWKTAFAIGGAAVIIFILTLIPFKSRHSHTQPDDGSIIHQTYNNFDGVLDGKLSTEVTSDNPSEVQSYLTDKVNFTVNVPHLKRCKLLGGMSSHYKDAALAHLIYRHGNDLIYLYQAKLGTVMNHRVLNVPQDAISDLQRTGWHVENHRPDCTLVMWIVDSTVCCAIADMDKDELLTSLKESE